MARFASVLVALLVTTSHGQADPETGPRRVYLLHSGVHIFFSHPDTNYAAKVLRRELITRKVPERDIIVLDNPFPQATAKSMVPREGLIMFLDAMLPRSRVAHDAYRRMHVALEAAGAGPKDEIVWIGHSAGGHVGMTMAHLAADLPKYPELAKDTRPYRFHTIVTLGTPVGCNLVPDDVRLVQYFSPQDKIVRIVCDGGPWFLPKLGYDCTFTACTPTPGKNCLARCWYNVEHPDWLDEPRILDRVMEDARGEGTSWWREPRAAAHAGAGLAQLLGRMLEEGSRICIEELPR